jgi:hypothetical protein
MISNPFTGIARPFAPARADMQRRRAELLGVHQQHEPQPQRETCPAPPTPPPESSGLKLGEAALYGVAGLAVRALAPLTEAHPAAILSPTSGQCSRLSSLSSLSSHIFATAFHFLSWPLFGAEKTLRGGSLLYRGKHKQAASTGASVN